jgi:hypothetical protein
MNLLTSGGLLGSVELISLATFFETKEQIVEGERKYSRETG